MTQQNASSPPRASQMDFPAAAEALDRLLRGLLEAHQRLLACLNRKKEAIRKADVDALAAMGSEESALVSRIEEIERHRAGVMAVIARLAPPDAAQPLTVSAIARMLPEPRQSHMLALAAQVRDALQDVRRESSVIRAAAESLSRHMTGLVRTVHSALSRARVYGNRGTIAVATSLPSMLDIKS